MRAGTILGLSGEGGASDSPTMYWSPVKNDWQVLDQRPSRLAQGWRFLV